MKRGKSLRKNMQKTLSTSDTNLEIKSWKKYLDQLTARKKYCIL